LSETFPVTDRTKIVREPNRAVMVTRLLTGGTLADRIPSDGSGAARTRAKALNCRRISEMWDSIEVYCVNITLAFFMSLNLLDMGPRLNCREAIEGLR
jgi:hypothetical protein